jgi:KUP system potassium uptake protein
MGLLGAALIYGDGAITPAISVLSALEGVNVATAAFKPYVMPMAVVILVALFRAALRHREDRPRVRPDHAAVVPRDRAARLNRDRAPPGGAGGARPVHGMPFSAHSGATGLLVLGGVFLCITGGEALYADMGHFGKGPIRWSWYLIVLPALLLSYAGQTAYLIDKGTVSGNPFFEIAPAVVDLSAGGARDGRDDHREPGDHHRLVLDDAPGDAVGLAARRAHPPDLGQCTARSTCPVVNWLMMIATVGITIGFGSSDRLAGAYGTAVSTTMLLTTVLLYQSRCAACGNGRSQSRSGRRAVHRRRCGLLCGQPAEDRRRRLAAADVRRCAVRGHADVAGRHRCDPRLAVASTARPTSSSCATWRPARFRASTAR